jgi:hypothetical protein
LNPVLYPGTLRPSATCADPKRCASFDITFMNTDKVTLNSFMFGIKGNPLVHLKLDGEAACTATGGRFGPNFADDWICLGLHIPPGQTFTGSGVATKPLTAATTARFDESNKGSIKGLLPDYSQDIHFYPVPAAAPAKTTAPAPKVKTNLRAAQRWLDGAISDEEEALAYTRHNDNPEGKVRKRADEGLTQLNNASTSIADAVQADELDDAAALQITNELNPAKDDDRKAINADGPNTFQAEKAWIQKALIKKEAAQRLIAAALKQ